MSFILGIVQARIGSSRLPKKVILPLNGKPAIFHVMKRAYRCQTLNKIYLATSDKPENNVLVEMANKYGWNIYCGSENDVLLRFVDIIREENPDIVVRICADNFAVDPEVITHGIKEVIEKRLDVCSSFIQNTYPFGAGAETSTAECLLRIEKATSGKEKKYRENIYFYAYDHPDKYNIGLLEAPENLRRPDINISVDTEIDYKRMRHIYNHFKGREHVFSLKELIREWDVMKKNESH